MLSLSAEGVVRWRNQPAATAAVLTRVVNDGVRGGDPVDTRSSARPLYHLHACVGSLSISHLCQDTEGEASQW